MNDPKFKEGQVVIYTNGPLIYLATIKSVVPGEHNKYKIWCHLGDTAAMCGEELLTAIENDYAYLLMRRLADPMDSELIVPAQELAKAIIKKLYSIPEAADTPEQRLLELSYLLNTYKDKSYVK